MSNSGNLLDSISLPSARGRKETPLDLVVVRELTEDDLANLDEEKETKTPPLVRIRTAHHALARLLAQGVEQAEISAITGYSPSRISILKQDPTFKELIAYYGKIVEEKFLDTHERLARLGNTFVDELQERLEEKPDAFSINQLVEGAKFAFDRSVAPPKSTGGASNGGGNAPLNLSISFIKPPSHPQLEIKRNVVEVIEVEAEE